MPAVPTGSTVLVTGASGFIAVHVVQQLLDRGYKVLGTVRSKEKGEWIKNKFPAFEYVIVEDLEKEGGFDEAVKDVDAIEHTASPFHFNVTDPYKDLVDPAVNGTLSVLKSAHKNGNKVKRIVITSSYASVVDTSVKPVHTFTEKDWNTFSPKELEKKGKDCDAMNSYRASKTLAERAAWDFVEKEKPAFDIVTLCPPFVIGPILHQVAKPESLNTSVAGWYAFLTGKKKGEEAAVPAGNQVDVRDLAAAHVESIAIEEAGNNRFAITNQAFSWQQCIDITYPNEEIRKAFPNLSEGKKGAGDDIKQNLYDGTKSKQVLGIKYKSLEQTVTDMSLSLAEREKAGWSS